MTPAASIRTTTQKAKPKNSLDGRQCPFCSKGKLETVQIDHAEKCEDLTYVSNLQIWVDRCDVCGEIIFSGETVRFMEGFIKEESDVLSCDELESIRLGFGVDQTAMSEILGLGAKSYHRWEKGTQFPSKSMCCYIRVLAEYPEAFKWLKKRPWKGKPIINKEEKSEFKFPALERSMHVSDLGPLNTANAPPRINFAKAFSNISIR